MTDDDRFTYKTMDDLREQVEWQQSQIAARDEALKALYQRVTENVAALCKIGIDVSTIQKFLMRMQDERAPRTIDELSAELKEKDKALAAFREYIKQIDVEMLCRVSDYTQGTRLAIERYMEDTP